MENNSLMGKTVKDKITGFQGIATSRHEYLTGCTQYGVQPPVDKDGKIPEREFFDEGRLSLIGDGFNSEEVKGAKPGCEKREKPNY